MGARSSLVDSEHAITRAASPGCPLPAAVTDKDLVVESVEIVGLKRQSGHSFGASLGTGLVYVELC